MIWTNKTVSTAIDLNKVSAFQMGAAFDMLWDKGGYGYARIPYPVLSVFVEGGKIEVSRDEATELHKILKNRFNSDPRTLKDAALKFSSDAVVFGGAPI